jgi:hypothetical protein
MRSISFGREDAYSIIGFFGHKAARCMTENKNIARLVSIGEGINKFICDFKDQSVWLPQNLYRISIENFVDSIPFLTLIPLGTYHLCGFAK